MERKRRGWYSEATLDFADRKSLTAGLHKQPENLQARGVAQLGQALGGGVEVHGWHIAFVSAECNHKTGSIEIIPGASLRASSGL